MFVLPPWWASVSHVINFSDNMLLSITLTASIHKLQKQYLILNAHGQTKNKPLATIGPQKYCQCVPIVNNISFHQLFLSLPYSLWGDICKFDSLYSTSNQYCQTFLVIKLRLGQEPEHKSLLKMLNVLFSFSFCSSFVLVVLCIFTHFTQFWAPQTE